MSRNCICVGQAQACLYNPHWVDKSHRDHALGKERATCEGQRILGNRAGGTGYRAGGTGYRAGGTGYRAGGIGYRAGGIGQGQYWADLLGMPTKGEWVRSTACSDLLLGCGTSVHYS